MFRDTSFSITYTVRKTPPLNKAVFANTLLEMKEKILGKGNKYELSVAIIGTKRMRTLNKRYRNIDKPTDILSFPISENEGQIFINPEYSVREARKFNRSYANFLYFLFIHGCVHLKGHDHGAKMEKLEEGYRKHFKI